MAFPTLQPTSRDFSPGDWPIKRYNSQSGAEVRILYGSRRTNAKLSLGYDNISDSNAQQFLDDYAAQYGTLRTFTLPNAARTGWSGTAASMWMRHLAQHGAMKASRKCVQRKTRA
jgi:hypothetical protein